VTEIGVRLTEVNGRGAVCFGGLYRQAFGASIFAAVADVACGLPPRELPEATGLVAGQFNLITHASGRVGDLVDFEAAQAFPHLRLFRQRHEHVQPVSEFGVVLGQLELAGTSYEEIHAEAERVRRCVLLRPETSPWHEALPMVAPGVVP
jgi:hypothetical protein